MLTIALFALLIGGSFAERNPDVESRPWHRTTASYGFDGRGSSGRDRSPSFGGDEESVRPAFGSDSSYDRATDSPRRFTSAVIRRIVNRRTNPPRGPSGSSYLDRFTTQRPYGSRTNGEYDSDTEYDRDDDSRGTEYGYGRYPSSRRPSYQTDRWGDAIGGEQTTQRSAYGYGRDRDTTDRWGLSGGRDRTSAWGKRTTNRAHSGET